ncbi:complex I subunit 4 family protein [Wolbachia endosymbiont of Glossina morsitans morsitans]|uniref:complex I subunit 4 family protein n=1 Tax=Wolbachia endosymbiont of Glossina morsitans morsitans TaxID=1150948 RepID=UPI00045AEBF1|nr:NADH-quinone oxidoreductase subunit M [Wolbachia endosymbiont of Glossina morsitans morsitans]KDB19494.1 NADH dehydrogenase I, M subunit [Wolbachia endosymbiont of Glossina morsitans morsitans]
MLLLSIFLLPLIGALILSLIRINHQSIHLRFLALFFAVLPFLLSIVACIEFDYNNADFQFVSHPIRNVGIGIDGISLLFLLLTTFLFVICILYNCKMSYTTLKAYMALFLLLESFVVGFFVSLNAISFYVFFEAVLIPMFFIIGIWGGKHRVYVTFKLFLYTLTGSLLFLLGFVYIYNIFGTFIYKYTNIQKLATLVPSLDIEVQSLLWIAFFISFAIKTPMFPFHTWLPDAHVQSPTSGSVILVGLLIKMGGYGFLRFSISMLPQASLYFSNFVVVLSIIAVIYASLVAFAQDDIKKLIAYSSIAHMGIVTAGLFSFCEEGVLGSTFQMISHGLISAALFLCVGMLYTRTGTLEIAKYFGIVNTMPKFGFMFILFSMDSIWLPGTSGFAGEFLAMVGMLKSIGFFTGFIALGTILSAVYMLNLCKQIIWGVSYSKLLNNRLDSIEFSVLILLAVFVILLGFYSTFALNYLKPCMANLLVKYNAL